MSSATTAQPIHRFVVSAHAAEQMARRGIGAEVLAGVLAAPGQRLAVRPGRDVLQSKVDVGEPTTMYLVRVFVDVDRDPAEVVTVYRTSHVDRYWQEAS